MLQIQHTGETVLFAGRKEHRREKSKYRFGIGIEILSCGSVIYAAGGTFERERKPKLILQRQQKEHCCG